MRKQPFILAAMGPAGTYGDSAAKNYAARAGFHDPLLLYGPIHECLAMVLDGRADLAVLPAENMVDGLIGATFDALLETPSIQIVDEVHLPICHVLAVRPADLDVPVRAVYSHSSALNQCAHSLWSLAPAARLIPVGSTAEAAARVASGTEPGMAAICAPEAAKAAALSIREPLIGDYPRNQTRFLVCGLEPALPSGDDLTIVAVRYGLNRPGQLFRTAGAFAGRGVDLSSVHSRPHKAKPQEYVLIYQLAGHHSDPPVAGALAEVAIQAAETGGWLRVLGSFPRRRIA